MLTFATLGMTLFAATDATHMDIPKGSVICNSEALAVRFIQDQSTPIMDSPGCSRIGVTLEEQKVLSTTGRVVQIQLTDGRTRRVRYLIVDSTGS